MMKIYNKITLMYELIEEGIQLNTLFTLTLKTTFFEGGNG